MLSFVGIVCRTEYEDDFAFLPGGQLDLRLNGDARIKARTGHLKGVKIAVMGCIVNGPGEMADADFGYVGWGEDKIALFVGKDMVERDIPTDRADGRLVELIKEHGMWVDPPVHATEAG